MLRALIRSVRRALRAPDRSQLTLDLAAPAPTDATALLARFRTLGLAQIERVVLTRNRRTMVSVAGRTLRLHEAYRAAPTSVHAAIVAFVMARRRPARSEAHRTIVEFARSIPDQARVPRAQRTHPDDAVIAARLQERHAALNAARFDESLKTVPVRVSRRMKSRLGHYSPARAGEGAEIAISRRHLRRHGFASAEETLLHEMVHQWQDERGLPVDHSPAFRQKAREVGISPRATRVVD